MKKTGKIWTCATLSFLFSALVYKLIIFLLPQFLQIKSLMGTKVEWLYYILEAFNSGDLVRYQELCRVHGAALSSQPALVQNEKKLLEKINILCLMEIIFRWISFFMPELRCIVFFFLWSWRTTPTYSRPSEDRTIPLSIIAERTKLTVEDVEYLLMKSLSVSGFKYFLFVMLNFHNVIKSRIEMFSQ